MGKENEVSREQEIGSVTDEVQLSAGHPCGLFQSALGGVDTEHGRVPRPGSG